jgi:glycerol-3-phosphate cytidylyltransferase
MKRILVDMSLTLLHHGHIRIIGKASLLGHVVVALVSDDEILRVKGYAPTLSFVHRKEIALGLRHVEEVIESKWLIDTAFLDLHNIDLLVHGDDNVNPVALERLVLFPRTKGISSSLLNRSD